MAQTEECADGHGAGAGRDEPARHQVDGRDVVGIQGVAEAQRVGERRRGEEVCVSCEDETAYRPRQEVDQDEQGYDQDRWEWE